MPVYSYKMTETLTQSLADMANLLFEKTPLVLSGEEFLKAFVDPEHITMLKQVQEICRPALHSYASTTLHSADGETLRIHATFIGSSPVILPQYVGSGLQPNCPDDIRNKIDAWIAERINLGRAFGDANDAIVYLNDNCGDVEAMALMLPCLSSVMANISSDGESKTVKRAQKLATIKRFGKLPRIPREVTQRLSEVSAIVNAVSMMKDAPDVSADRHSALFKMTGIGGSGRVNIFYQNPDPNTPVPVASFL
jgi:hypothetical protein